MTDFRAMTRAVARKYGIPEELALAQIGQESGFNPGAVSPAGARGIAQFMPGTAKGYGIDPMNPTQALNAYGKMMSSLGRSYKGNWRLALAAYNAGAGAVKKYGGIPPYKETQNYVSSIMQHVKGGGSTPARMAQSSGGGAAAQGGSGAAAAPGAVGSLQLDPQTMKLINRWMSVEDAALAKGGLATKQSERLWSQVEQRLMSAARQPVAPRVAVTQAGQQVGSMASTAGQAMQLPPGTSVAPIMAGKVPTQSAFSYVDAEGAPDSKGTRHHGAIDWFGKAHSTVYSPVAGKVVEVKASRGNSGQIFGGVVKVQGPGGRVYVLRHVDPGNVKVGQRVSAGAPVARITDWTGGADHVHYEVWKSLAGGYRYDNMIDPLTLYRR